MPEQQLITFYHGDGVGMIKAKARFKNLNRAPHQRLDLRQTARGLKQLRQIVEVYACIRMVGAEAPRVNRQRASVKRFSFRKLRAFLQVIFHLIQQSRNLPELNY
ncbi:MAG TPA: hypothetical protein PLK30_07360 [Blastocatellia bacterium]|nr:hypothetical protein [Blastocatellia bacterium]